jgi:hypothetical protein
MLLEHPINHDRPDPLGISSMGRVTVEILGASALVRSTQMTRIEE